MTPAVAALLPGNRLHLQHGPIDLVIAVEGDRSAAFAAARARFATVLQELVAEMELLRRPIPCGIRDRLGEYASLGRSEPRRRMVAAAAGRNGNGVPRGDIAGDMWRASAPHADGIVTPMAAVAGAVAQAVLAAMVSGAQISRAYVNNGGDIALHLTGAESYRLAVAAPDGTDLGRIDIAAADPVRGIATSGQGGRSLSLGIADAVTVLARSAAEADVAATLIGNAVDLPGHSAVDRVPAQDVRPDSDLGAHPVVIRVGTLSESEVDAALDRGLAKAQTMMAQGLIAGAALFLRGTSRATGLQGLTISQGKTLAHA